MAAAGAILGQCASSFAAHIVDEKPLYQATRSPSAWRSPVVAITSGMVFTSGAPMAESAAHSAGLIHALRLKWNLSSWPRRGILVFPFPRFHQVLGAGVCTW